MCACSVSLEKNKEDEMKFMFVPPDAVYNVAVRVLSFTVERYKIVEFIFRCLYLVGSIRP
jgi:hypothetical protein